MKTQLIAVMLSTLLCAPAAYAQDAMPETEMSPEMQAMMTAWELAKTPGEQHARLAEHFEGTWDVSMQVWMEPGADPARSSGTSINTMVLGGRQLHMDYTGNFFGEEFKGIGYTGYDNVTGRYTGIWTDNMTTGTMLTTGTYDPATNSYTFTGQMPDPMHAGVLVPLREVITVVDRDHHMLEMFETRDGAEQRTMVIEYRRAE